MVADRDALIAQGSARAAWLAAHESEMRRAAELEAVIATRMNELAHRALTRPPQYLVARLGPPPSDDRPRQAWAQAAATVEAYRERNHITDTEHPLGPAIPGDFTAARDRYQANRELEPQ